MQQQTSGPRPLSRQEWLVVCCWVSGMTAQQTAFSLYISPHTVRSHIKSAKAKRGWGIDRLLFDPGPAPTQAKAPTRKL